jgi:RNA polymerase sigma factor (sigma-70 family)
MSDGTTVDHDSGGISHRLDDEQRSMVQANVPLVWHVVLRILRLDGDTAEEAAAAGMLGLIRAVQKFDPELGYTFSTYATSWIRQAVSVNHATLAGASYRRAKRRGEPWQEPLSLDQVYGDPDDGITLADNLTADDDPAITAIDQPEPVLLNPTILAACTDDLDRRLVTALADGRTIADLARDTGRSHQGLTLRLKRIRRRLAGHAHELQLLDETAA